MFERKDECIWIKMTETRWQLSCRQNASTKSNTLRNWGKKRVTLIFLYFTSPGVRRWASERGQSTPAPKSEMRFLFTYLERQKRRENFYCRDLRSRDTICSGFLSDLELEGRGKHEAREFCIRASVKLTKLVTFCTHR